jgi:hypothetical protein
MTSCTGSPGFPPGRTYAKFHASSALAAILQYPSFKSSFENMNGVVSSFDRAIAQGCGGGEGLQCGVRKGVVFEINCSIML